MHIYIYCNFKQLSCYWNYYYYFLARFNLYILEVKSIKYKDILPINLHQSELGVFFNYFIKDCNYNFNCKKTPRKVNTFCYYHCNNI